MTDKEDKTVRQFVLFCRTALMYEKKNYYNERKHRAERETHIEMLSLKQSGMAGMCIRSLNRNSLIFTL